MIQIQIYLVIYRFRALPFHYSLYPGAYYLVHTLVELDPGQLVFIAKKGI